MDIFTWTVIIMACNFLFGCLICSLLDTEDDVWLKWLEIDYTGIFHFIIVSLWPILSTLMITYRIQQKETKPTHEKIVQVFNESDVDIRNGDICRISGYIYDSVNNCITVSGIVPASIQNDKFEYAIAKSAINKGDTGYIKIN